MARLEIVAGEAHQERRTYLTHEFDPDPLVRAVFRLRNDVVMIGRAAAEPLPEPIGARLHAPFEQISQVAQHFLRACADALRERKSRQLLTQPSRRSLILPRLSRSYGVTVLREYYP
jgi:hypothetical protein